MKIPKTVYVVPICVLALLLCVWKVLPQAGAQEENKYVGSDTCATCHSDVAKAWALTSHRRSLFSKDETKNGCEACHGPGGQHVAGGGDKTKILKLSSLKPQQIAEKCMKCHKQEHVTLWSTSAHAKAKVTCLSCHDVHAPDSAMMSKDIENGTTALDALTTVIKKSELEANEAASDSSQKAEATAKVEKLKQQADGLRDKVKGAQDAYKRVAEPYICYNCHKSQQVQSKMPSHHPLAEGKMNCSDCHNPHGGPNGMLNAESVNETCYKCHAEKAGPFTFEHPPVVEDCGTCHNPHGSVQNNLLVQSEPFVCMKCHIGPHSRSKRLNKPDVIPQYYSECTDCHATVHGSDQHAALHY